MTVDEKYKEFRNKKLDESINKADRISRMSEMNRITEQYLEQSFDKIHKYVDEIKEKIINDLLY